MNYQLCQTPEGLVLTHPEKSSPFIIDFSQGKLKFRIDHCRGRNELLAKAIGWKNGNVLQLWDTTAGLGREAFLLASLGCQVTLFERHPIIAALLQDALFRAAKIPTLASITARMTLKTQCAIEFIETYPTQTLEQPDIIYCDPMFEPRTKSALVKKEMQMLQTLVGTDLDASHLIDIALSTAKKRVIVKRPLSAPALKKAPQIVYKARSHRFDVYLIP